MFNANAACTIAPPMIVLQYERPPKHVTDSIPEEWGIGLSESRWMCSHTFYEYVNNVFNPWVIKNNIPKPIVLFLDGNGSHMSLQLSQYCKEKNITLIALYLNSTHICQPLDMSFFGPLKKKWKAVIQ